MGVSFKELAKQVFTDTTLRNNGGSLGYITWGYTDPSFESVAYSLKVGEVSRPVNTAQGYSIIKVDDRIEDPFTTETEFLNRKHKRRRWKLFSPTWRKCEAIALNRMVIHGKVFNTVCSTRGKSIQ
jgi:parvulin-like peptidyl-prolyl isomerase